jgi:hypothetical protein
VIEDKSDTRRIKNGSYAELLTKYPGYEVRAEIVHDHQIDVCDDHVSRRDFRSATRLREDFFNHVHKIVLP